MKRDTANRGGERTLPQTRRVSGAYGKEGPARKTPARAPAAGKVPKARGRAQRRRAA